MSSPVVNSALQCVTKLFSRAEKFPSVIYVTGGGGALLSWLTSVPGCSSFLLEGGIPYAMQSSSKLMRKFTNKVESYCSSDAATLLAKAALDRAVELQMQNGISKVSPRTLGFGLTAALVSGAPKRGDHRVYVSAAHLDGKIDVWSLTLSKGARDRVGEDAMSSALLLDLILHSTERYSHRSFSTPAGPTDELTIKPSEVEVCEPHAPLFKEFALQGEELIFTSAGGAPAVPPPIPDATPLYSPAMKVLPPPTPTSPIEVNPFSMNGLPVAPYDNDKELQHAVRQLLAGEIQDFFIAGHTGAVVRNARPNYMDLAQKLLVVPGSFNPIHDGHEAMALAAEKTRDALDCSSSLEGVSEEGESVVFELSLVNAEKNPVAEFGDLLTRLRNFRRHGKTWSVLATASRPLFIQKAELLKGGCDFAVGFDTYRRMIDPKYTPQKTLEGVLAVLLQLKHDNVRVFVAGRLDQNEFRSFLYPGQCGEILAFREGSSELLKQVHDEVFHPLPDFRVDRSSTEIRQAILKQQEGFLAAGEQSGSTASPAHQQ